MNDDRKDTSSIRVIIQQNQIAHYRTRLFELLSQNQEIRFIIVADTKSDTPFLKTFDGTEGRTIRYVQCDTKFIRIPGIPSISWQPRGVRFIWHERPDLVIVMGSPYSLTAWLAGITGRIFGIPVIMWGHGLLKEESGPKWWIRRSLYRLARGHLLYGDYAKRLLAARGFSASTLYVVYNSLDLDAQDQVFAKITNDHRMAWRRQLGATPEDGVVIFTGRLQPAKRLDLLVLAVAHLAKKGKKVHVAVIGDGSEKESLMKLAAVHSIEKLMHFLGERYDEAYLGLALSSSDLSVVPSGAGLSIMHALTYGTPVLIHDRVECHFPEWEAVKDGITGFYYRYGDVEDLAEKISSAIFPVPARAHMADQCRNVIRTTYNPHRQVEIISAMVKEVLANSRK